MAARYQARYHVGSNYTWIHYHMYQVWFTCCEYILKHVERPFLNWRWRACVHACECAGVRACVSVCECACVRVSMCAFVRVCVKRAIGLFLNWLKPNLMITYEMGIACTQRQQFCLILQKTVRRTLASVLILRTVNVKHPNRWCCTPPSLPPSPPSLPPSKIKASSTTYYISYRDYKLLKYATQKDPFNLSKVFNLRISGSLICSRKISKVSPFVIRLGSTRYPRQQLQ